MASALISLLSLVILLTNVVLLNDYRLFFSKKFHIKSKFYFLYQIENHVLKKADKCRKFVRKCTSQLFSSSNEHTIWIAFNGVVVPIYYFNCMY